MLIFKAAIVALNYSCLFNVYHKNFITYLLAEFLSYFFNVCDIRYTETKVSPGRIRTWNLSFTVYNSNWEVLGSNPSEGNIIFLCPKIC
mgnify:CR=1 FL=1